MAHCRMFNDHLQLTHQQTGGVRAHRLRFRRALLVHATSAAAPALSTGLSSNGASSPSTSYVQEPETSREGRPPVLTLNVPEPVPGVVPPPKAYQNVVGLGVAKASMPASKVFLMGILAGAYIGFGAFLMMSVGGNCAGLAASNPGLQKIIAGSFGLPFGLLMVLICGGELFTGNTALVTTAVLEGKASISQLAKSWVVSYAGNLVGSLLLVGIVAASGLFVGAAAPLNASVAKTSLPFIQAFARGILCNWLVCIAIWQATAATTLSGKALGVYFPISAFIALGLEHSVANMFIIPMGIVSGASVTFWQFLAQNLLPVTLGNIVGGALCVATMYSLVFRNSTS